MTFAVTPGAWIFIAIVIVILIGVCVSAYSRRSTGISEHPIDDRAAAPGAAGGADEELPGNTGTR